jgi:CRISPR-associated protein Csh1
MIREIINYTENLIVDIPNIMQWKVQPTKGLHIFIDIDENGKWKNFPLEKGKDYDYYDGKDTEIPLWNECIRFQEISDYITMNKVQKFDSKQKIHSCSPFSVAFNFNFNDTDKKSLGITIWKKGSKPTKEEKEKTEKDIREKRIQVIKERLTEYARCASTIFFSDNNPYENEINTFINLVNTRILDSLNNIEDFNHLSGKDYVRINYRNFGFKIQQELYSKYLQQEILNGEELSSNTNVGALGFMTTFPDKKPFMRHKTSIQLKGVNCRFSRQDALTLNNFSKLLERNVLPNPLPIVVDRREINSRMVKIFNENNNALGYKDLIKRLFERVNIGNISDYYLLFYTKTMSGLVFNDFDFVPMFRYTFDPKLEISNITESGITKDKIFEKYDDIKINTIFDFERIVVREIFNNSLIKIKDEKYSANYFSTIDLNYVSGGDEIYQLIMKYRKAFYDYIYKSKNNALNELIFDDIMFHSILSNIKKDEIKGKFDWNNTIKMKINIWFSLYKLFSNNKTTEIMASKVTGLMSKMRSVVKGESILEKPEEFAFGAGQVVSYLIDRSVASNKSYALLEPYLQKTKSNLLQDAIAQTIAVYKHEISTYRGAFQSLASNVLTYDENIEVKPLLKYFLAGCFCPCVIYDKKDDNKIKIGE